MELSISRAYFLSLCISFVPICVSGQTPPSVQFGNTQVALGMSADQALASLRKEFRVEDVVEPVIHQWVIERATFPHEILGFLNAQTDDTKVIIGVEHLVLSRSLESADDVFDALFEALAKVSLSSSQCGVHTWTDYRPGVSTAGVLLRCGSRRYRLVRNDFQYDDPKSTGQKLSGHMVQGWEDIGDTKDSI